MIKRFVSCLLLSASTALGTVAVAADNYPARNIQAVVPWGAGGATDNIARSLLPIVEKDLGRSLVISNRAGGTGVIGTRYAMQQRADGYTVLVAAENAQLYPLLELADFDYSALELIALIGQNVGVVVVPADSPYNTMEELLAAVDAQPGKLRMGSTGAGGLPNNVLAMMSSVHPLDVRQVVLPGDGPGVTALMGNHIDFMTISLSAVREPIAAGRLKGLALINAEPLDDLLPGIPPITKALPKMESYFPWGSFWGVWVRKETPAAISEKLRASFTKAIASEDGQKVLKRYGATSLNLSGKEGEEYLKRWQSVTAWSIADSGSAKVSPETLGIPRP